MGTPALLSNNFSLVGRWVPGTFDRVRLNRGCAESLELSIEFLWQVFGREVVDALYLRGVAQLECDPQLWTMLEAGCKSDRATTV